MQFHINIAFWELLRKRSPQIAELVQPQFTDHRETFDIRLFEGKQKKLEQPTDLEFSMERIDKNGKRIPTKTATGINMPPKILLSRWLNNILVIICTVLSTLLTLIVILLLAKHFKMKSLIASLAIATLAPPSMATAIKPTTEDFKIPGIQIIEPTLKHYLNPEKMTYFPFIGHIYKNCENIVDAFPQGTTTPKIKFDDWTKGAALVKPEKLKKVVCSYPITTMWRNVLSTMVICYTIFNYIRPMTWYRGYKYSRNCTFICLCFVTTITAH